ncbi:hypothetical protein ABZ721_12370 [Streptomyces sp. NPDC006733]|uniref:hypothetical protein n=1 Tax=Streptomyces sp. NPDC006733 TaxID=3155460 RepID=UPI0033EF5D22
MATNGKRFPCLAGPELGGPGPVPDADGTTRPATPDLDLPGGGPLDSHVALVDAQGRPSHRRPLHRLAVTGATAGSRHQASWPQLPDAAAPQAAAGPWVTTGSVLRGSWEVRAVRVDGEPAGLRLRIGGWAVAHDRPPEHRSTDHGADVRSADGHQARCAALLGSMRAGVRTSAGRTSYGTHAAVGYLQSTAAVRPGEVYVAAIALGRALTAPPTVTVRTGDGDGACDDVLVSWPDGHHDVLRLDHSPTPPIPAEGS